MPHRRPARPRPAGKVRRMRPHANIIIAPPRAECNCQKPTDRPPPRQASRLGLPTGLPQGAGQRPGVTPLPCTTCSQASHPGLRASRRTEPCPRMAIRSGRRAGGEGRQVTLTFPSLAKRCPFWRDPTAGDRPARQDEDYICNVPSTCAQRLVSAAAAVWTRLLRQKPARLARGAGLQRRSRCLLRHPPMARPLFIQGETAAQAPDWVAGSASARSAMVWQISALSQATLAARRR